MKQYIAKAKKCGADAILFLDYNTTQLKRLNNTRIDNAFDENQNNTINHHNPKQEIIYFIKYL